MIAILDADIRCIASRRQPRIFESSQQSTSVEYEMGLKGGLSSGPRKSPEFFEILCEVSTGILGIASESA